MSTPGPDTPATPPEVASASGTAQAARPEPVRNAAAVASLLTTIAGVVLLILVATHVLTAAGQAILGPVLAAAIPTVVGAVSTLVAAFHARAQVTPLSSPLSAAGNVLVELEAVGEQVAGAIAEVRRPPGPQTPGKADHAAPEG